MRVLVTGGRGQLGLALRELMPRETEGIFVDIDELDITDLCAVEKFIIGNRPDVIINTAAYTAVDKAESEEDTAMRINRDGIANIAVAAAENHIRVLQVSTDFVFDGTGHCPYQPDDNVNPVSVYGRTKAAGEQELLRILPGQSAVVRTAWLYSPYGNNFMKTMLKLMAQREKLNVVCDQIGTPTGANTLAQTLWTMAARPEMTGIYHCTDAGVASWYDFAQAIREEGEACGILSAGAAVVAPINTSDYPTPAKRPHYSVLDKFRLWNELQVTPMHWRQNLRIILAEYYKNRS